jgi:NAD(P)-dependent dehydrogenase (short-subunit alcohol dehydrogenase family)
VTSKVALVTGASRGVGAALALALAKEGYVVACAARSTRARPEATEGTLDDVVDRIRDAGGHSIALSVDLADREQVALMVDQTVTELGRLDVLVNNAAVLAVDGLDGPLDMRDRMMAVNLDAPYIACRHAVPYMRAGGGGRILNVSSLTALRPVPGVHGTTYSITKIGLERLTMDLHRELKSEGIAVNCYRIDVGVASEGVRGVYGDIDLSSFETPAVAAEGMAWMLRQPVTYSGQRESMRHLAHREGIMPTVAAREEPLPPTTFGWPPATEPSTNRPSSFAG